MKLQLYFVKTTVINNKFEFEISLKALSLFFYKSFSQYNLTLDLFSKSILTLKKNSSKKPGDFHWYLWWWKSWMPTPKEVKIQNQYTNSKLFIIEGLLHNGYSVFNFATIKLIFIHDIWILIVVFLKDEIETLLSIFI